MTIIIHKYTEDYSNSGLTSQISWKTALPHFKAMFGVKPHEYITGIEVTEQGITVRLDHKKNEQER